MFTKVLYPLLVIALFLAACAPSTGSAPTNDQPVTNAPPTGAVDVPANESFEPQPGDEVLAREEVEIEKVDLLTLESFPPQFRLHIVGWKGNPCNILRIAVPEPDAQNQIQVNVYTLLDPAATCIQMLEGFDVQVPLESLETGEYTVFVNGSQVG